MFVPVSDLPQFEFDRPRRSQAGMNEDQRPETVQYAQPKRIECLDSIRGLAALAVLLRHIQGAFAWPTGMTDWINIPIVNILFDGRSAVTMFFVLSGFVLAHPYLAPTGPGQVPRKLFIPTFYLRRVIRIWVPWLFAFVLSVLASRYLFGKHSTIPPVSEWLDGFWHAPLTVMSVLRQCAFTLHDASQQLLPQDWSLGVELKGSALVPLFLFFVRRFMPGLVITAGLLLVFVPTGDYYVSFALGVLAAKYHWQAEPWLRSLSLASKCGMLALGVLLYQSRLAADRFWGITEATDRIVWCVGSVGCVLILGATLASRRIQAKLGLSVFVFLGRISFSVYLLQFIVILCMLPPLVQILNGAGLDSAAALLPMLMLVGVAGTVALASAMYYTIEKSSIEWGRTLTRYVQRRFFGR